ncbi:MAG: hypothetical protein L6R42_010665, partial [Xanthoria sp. 1 TBL-2021]
SIIIFDLEKKSKVDELKPEYNTVGKKSREPECLYERYLEIPYQGVNCGSRGWYSQGYALELVLQFFAATSNPALPPFAHSRNRTLDQTPHPKFFFNHSDLTSRKADTNLSDWVYQRPQEITKANAPATSIVSAAIGLVYANYLYQTYIIGEFAAFPEPVARKLRRALYYSNYDIQPENALKYYKQALAAAEEIGMDPFSDEIFGVKFQLASFFENQIHQPRMAIEVLERVRQNCLDWERELGGEPKNRGKRTRVLGQCVRMSVKLGELYAGPQIMESEHAEESLVWAVTTLLKEQSRREQEGVRDEEGEWMNAEEIGGALECITSSALALPQLLQPAIIIPA